MPTASFPSNQLASASIISSARASAGSCGRKSGAQFAAFAATGLVLDHANAHKHMHLHPTVGAMMLAIGRDFGLRRIRVPAEPPAIMARCGTPVGWGDKVLYRWTGVLRRQARAAGIAVPTIIVSGWHGAAI